MMTLKRCIFAAKFKSKNSMKGMVGLCYEMPQWEAYLETADVAFSEVQRIQLKNEIHDFLSDAVLELVEENRSHLMEKLHDSLKKEEIFEGSNKIFQKMPSIPEDIVFDTDISTFLEEELLLEAEESLQPKQSDCGNHGGGCGKSDRNFKSLNIIGYEKN